MSEFTVQVRFVLEQSLADKGVDDWLDESEWPKVWKVFGLDDYPIYDEAHRDELNTKILRRYMFREIGQETVALFRFMVRRHMHEVMPYYNMLYETLLLVDDPLSSFSTRKVEDWDKAGRMNETATGKTNVSRETQDSGHSSMTGGETNESTSHETRGGNRSENGRRVFSDTPMSLLDNGDDGPTVEGLDYATTVTHENMTGNESETVDGSDTGESASHSETVSGSIGVSKSDETTVGTTARGTGETGERETAYSGRREPQAEMLEKYRDAWYNVDLMVVDSLNGYFMMVY